MITLALAIILQVAAWEGVEADGWTYRGEATSGQMLYFTRPVARVTDRLWVRFEYTPDHPNSYGFKSTRALIAADCEGGRLRSLQTTSFQERNLEGESASAGEEDWFYPGPDTVHAMTFELICGEP